MTDSVTAPPQAVMMQMIHWKLLSRCVSLVAELCVPDHLSEGPQTADALAAVTETNPDALGRVLRMLTRAGVFEELPDGRFQNNALSKTLRSGAAGSLRGYARWLGTEFHWKLASDLDYSVRTGKPSVYKRQSEKNAFEALLADPGALERFNDAMSGISAADGAAVVQSYDFSRFDRIIDVGGGHGMLAQLIAQAAPQSTVRVLDLPHVIEGTAQRLEREGHADRVEAVPGNFFEHVPGPVDLCVLKHTIHDWDDEDSRRVLANCRAALNEGGRIVLCEYLLDEQAEGPESLGARLLDIEMLVGPGGRERTAEEFERLFASADMKLTQIIETPTAIRLIEAVPV